MHIKTSVVAMVFGAVFGCSAIACAPDLETMNDDLSSPAASKADSKDKDKDSDRKSSSSSSSGSTSPAPSDTTLPPPSTTPPPASEDPPRDDNEEDPPAQTTPPPAKEVASFTNVAFEAASRCMDAAGSQDPGANVIAWSCHLEGNQRFTLFDNGQLKSQKGTCIDIPSGKKTPILWMCHTGVVGANQKWAFDSKTKTLRSQGKCMTSKPSDNTLAMETCNGSSAQTFVVHH